MQIFKKWHKENRGLTLIELVCAVAIFSLIGGTVCGIMAMTAKNFNRDSTEIELQQEAQMTVNQIQNLIMDATGEAAYFCKVGASDVPCKNETEALSFGAIAMGDRTLQIKKTNRLYVISYLASTKKIEYSEYIVTGGVPSAVGVNQLMAENVTEFSADISDYETNGNLNLKLSLSKSDREYSSTYTVSTRNRTNTISAGDAAAFITTESEIVLEPNQNYILNATVVGPSDTTVIWSMPASPCPETKVFKNPSGFWQIHIGKDEVQDSFPITVRTNAKKEDGVTPQAQTSVLVKIRRVTAINLAVTLTSGTRGQAGAEYYVTADVNGNNLNKIPGIASDLSDYVEPKKAEFSCQYSISGISVSNQADYYTMYDVTDTSFKLRLIRSLETDAHHLQIIAVAKHPRGQMGSPLANTNKTGLEYDNIFAYYTLNKVFYTFNGGLLYRGTDTAQGTMDISGIKNIILASGGPDTDSVGRKYRFRQILTKDDATGARTYGPWTGWAPMTAEGGNSINLRPNETYRFECDKDYELQIKFFMYKDSESNVLWPFYDTPEEEYTISSEITRVKMAFSSSRLGISNARTCGNASTPVPVPVNAEIDMKMDMESESIWGYNFNHNQGCLMMKVEKWNGTDWEDAATSDYTLNLNGITQTQKVTLRTAGTYRVLMGMKDIRYRMFNYSTMTGSDTTRDYWIGNNDTGEGIYYIEAY